MAELITAEILYALASAGIDVSLATATAISVGSYVVVAGTAYAVAQSMIKAPSFGTLQSETSGKVQMTRDTVASRRVIYGTVRVSGPIIFVSTNGNKNEFLHMIVAIAGHEISQLHTIFFNDNIAYQNDAQNTALYPDDRLAMTYKIGASSGQTAYSMEPSTEWTGTDTLDGIASIYARMTADPKVFPNGIPNISAVVTGRKIKDIDGNDINSGSYSNPALILNDYLLNYFGAAANEIETGSFKSSQIVCDQTPFSGSGDYTKRYTCNYSFTQNVKPAKIIEDILKTCYGKLTYVNGQFVLNVGYYRTPVISINEDDIIGNITVTTKPSQASSYNRVNGLFVDGSTYTSSFQAADFVPITDSYYLAEDNNIESAIDIELSGVTDHSTARRIAKLNLLDSRQDLSVQFTTKISGLQLMAGDNVYVTVERYGWAAKVFEVIELTINNDLSVSLTLKETANTIYDFPVDQNVDRDLSPNTNLPSPFFVAPPLGFSAIETTTIDKDGTIFPAATLNWSSSLTGSVSDIEVDFKITSSADYDTLGKFGRDTTTFTTIDVEAGKTYSFRARNFNYLGVFSEYVSQSLKINGDTTRPQPPYAASIIGGSGSLYVTWTNNPVDRDYKFTQIFVASGSVSASAVNQGTVAGTSWNKVVTTAGDYSIWMKNIDTSGNESDVYYAGSGIVSAIGQGEPGPAGPSGSAGFNLTSIYRRSTTTPAGAYYPTGDLIPSANSPFGWLPNIPSDDGQPLWTSQGAISGADQQTLSGSWSAPQRLNGRVSYFETEPPSGSLAAGDIWFDTNGGMRAYRWNGSSWVSVQDETIPSITGSILTMTSSIVSVTSSSLANTLNILSATGSIANLYTQSFALSSSYGATSASLNNVYATFASKDFAVAVAAFSSSVAFNSATGSANAYTDSLLVSYATQTYAQTIAQTTSTASFNSATASANARTDTLLTNYASRTESETFSQQSSTASFNSATSSANAYTLTQLGGYATTDSSQAYSRQQITASINQGGIVSASNAASVAVNAAAVATLSGSVVNLSAEYGVVVNAGKVTGFKILSSPTTSSFIIQADQFKIITKDNTSERTPFAVEGGVTYIDGAVINRIDAGIITAGTVAANIRLTSPEITGSGFMITGTNGMRYQNNSGVLTITGGSANGTDNGAQLDLVGNSAGGGIAGVAQIIAGNVSTGHILLKTGGDNTRLKIDNNGTVGINTTSPDSSYKLDVNGDIKSNGEIKTSGAIGRITNTGYTPNLFDGSNQIAFGWIDGALYANIDNDGAIFEIGSGGGGSGTSGTSGANGTSGTSGNNGANGNNGTSGTSGNAGNNGTSGTSGNNGANGDNGTSGTSGYAGNDGTSGTSGNNGNDGDAGTSGTSGNNGNDGDNGTSGSSGYSGTSGTSGNNGNDGDNGTSGTSGYAGNNGTSGTSGNNGNDGDNGTSGTSGYAGTSGTSGNNGVNGDNGTSGTSGYAGDNGTSGTSGNNGADGANGTSGTSGVSAGSDPTFSSVTIAGYGSVITEGWGFRFAADDSSHPAQFQESIVVGTFVSAPSLGSGNGYFTGTTYSGYSDARLKTDITNISGSLNKVCTLNGITYRPDMQKQLSLGLKPVDKVEVGLLAAEVQAVLPEAVFTAPFDMAASGSSKSGQNYLGVKYESVIPLLVEAIKELKAEIDYLKSK